MSAHAFERAAEMKHHPIFERFPCYEGEVQGGFEVDFVGSRNRLSFRSPQTQGGSRRVQTSYPPLSEEYFEWIDILESVVAARDQFTMVELGAGFGRWSMRAACALRSYSNLPVFLATAEAEPSHFKWMELHFQDNQFDPAQHRLVQCAVTDRGGEALFYVGMPDGGRDAPHEWYGQALTKDYEVADKEVFDGDRQKPVVHHTSGWKSISVPCRTLPELIGDLKKVDLIDLDVQGEEAKVVRASASLLHEKVRRLHIGTHSTEIEASLRETLSAGGWQCLADYACGVENETPFGPVAFADGVQSWLNPRLA